MSLFVIYFQLRRKRRGIKPALRNKVREVGLLDLVATDPGAVLSIISPTLCKPFGVSDQVIERRVEREGLWPPKY